MVLTLVCVLVFGSGLTAIPVLDRDEARFAQVTLQMIESGDYWTVAYQDAVQASKPHAVHWLQALSVQALSSVEDRAIWVYRLPSSIAAGLAILFTYLLGRDLFGRRDGQVAGLFLTVAPVVIAVAHMAIAEAMLLATVVAAQWSLARAYMAAHGGPEPGVGFAALFWGSLVASALTKGAIGPAAIVLTVISLCVIDRSVGWLRPLWPLAGATMAALVLVTWALRAGITPQTVPGVGEAILQLVPHLYLGPGSSGTPPGIHALIALLALGPALPFTIMGLAGIRRDWQRPEIRFCFAWAIPAWIAVELVADKLPHHPLPLYPALMLLACWGVRRLAVNDSTSGRVIISVWGSMSVALSLAAIGYLTIPTWQPGLASLEIISLSLINLIGALAVIIFGAAGRPYAAATMAACTAAVIFACTASFAFPRIEAFWVTDRIVAALERNDGMADRRLVVVGYGEPSLVFRTATETEVVDRPGELSLTEIDGPLAFAVDDRHRAEFEQHAAASDINWTPAEAVSGFNYSAGRWTTIWLYFP